MQYFYNYALLLLVTLLVTVPNLQIKFYCRHIYMNMFVKKCSRYV